MFEWHFPILNLFSFDCPHVLSYGENHINNDLSYICQPYIVILTMRGVSRAHFMALKSVKSK